MISLIALIPYGKMMSYWIFGLMGVGFIISFHELGHFLFCKLFNIRTPTFSIGFGPILMQKRIGTTQFVISAIPMGGYVEMAQEQDSSIPREQIYTDKPYYQKLCVILGGILFNFLFAYGVITALYWTGMPDTTIAYPANGTATVQYILPDSPAAQQGIKEQDVIVSYTQELYDHPFTSTSSFLNFVYTHPHQLITLHINRQGTAVQIPVTIGQREQDPTHGYLGVIFKTTSLAPLPFLQAIRTGITTTNHLITLVARGFWNIVTRKSKEQLGGPIMLISQTAKTAEQGFSIFITLLAIISINLALINFFPLPIFDGGQLLIATLEALFRRSIPSKVKEAIFIACWLFVLGAIVYISFNDIKGLYYKKS